jgi:hypothetical protein
MPRKILVLLLVALLPAACSSFAPRPQSTQTSQSLQANASPTSVLTATATETTMPSETPVIPVETSLPTEEVNPLPASGNFQIMEPESVHYIVQPGTPIGVPNFVRPDSACNWSGVAGQVFDSRGSPVEGLVVEVGGTLDGKDVLFLGLTGGAKDIGPGGYEISLGDQPVESEGTLVLHLFDLSGVPQSDVVHFDTYGNCDQNVVLLNFTAIQLTVRQYLPAIVQQSELHP